LQKKKAGFGYLSGHQEMPDPPPEKVESAAKKFAIGAAATVD
jgi:hypothetical protein